jgi:hypothetical protein
VNHHRTGEKRKTKTDRHSGACSVDILLSLRAPSAAVVRPVLEVDRGERPAPSVHAQGPLGALGQHFPQGGIVAVAVDVVDADVSAGSERCCQYAGTTR